MDKIIFLLYCEHSVNFNCCNECNCMEGGYVLSLNAANLEFDCIAELVYHCPIMTRWCPCGSASRHDACVVHDAHSAMSILYF